MREMIWYEKNPVRGKIRRYWRAFRAFMATEWLPISLVIAIMGVMIISTLITIGEYLSGPVVVLSPSHHRLSFPPPSPGHDPKVASGMGHGHLAGVEE